MFYGIWRTGQVKVLRPASATHRGRNFTPVAYSSDVYSPIFAIPSTAIVAITSGVMKVNAVKWHGFLCGDYDPTSIERIAEIPRTVKVYSDYDGIVEVAGEAYIVGGSGVLTKIVTPPSYANIGNYLGLNAGYYDGGVLKARTALTGDGAVSPNDIPVLIATNNHDTTNGTTQMFQIVDILYSATGNAVFVCRVNSSVLAV